MGKHRTAIVKCKNCTVEFEARQSDIKKGWGKYCSTSCSSADKKGANNSNWKNGESRNHNKYRKRYRARHRKAVLANEKIQRMVKTGKLLRQPFCENCGDETKTHAHHEDYDKPLEVNWLCARCHRIRHGATC